MPRSCERPLNSWRQRSLARLANGECLFGQQASSHLEDWPLSHRANGTVAGSLALRLAGLPPRALPVGLVLPMSGRLPVK